MEWAALALFVLCMIPFALAPRHRLIRNGPIVRLPMPEILRICWADRVAAIWAVVVLGVLYMLHAPGVAPSAWGDVVLTLIVPLWIFLRLLDLIMGGPRRRKSVRVEPAARLRPY